MLIWGGENFELSFKAWMCPDLDPEQTELDETKGPEKPAIQVLPCSRVGHVFRSWSPYNSTSNLIHRNNIRVADVWMDDFKYLHFDRY